MIRFPKLTPLASSRQMLRAFGGYNQNLRIKEGEFSKMENMCSDDYPVLSVRKKRGLIKSIQSGKCASMLYVPGKGVFFATFELDNGAERSDLYLLTQDGQTKHIAHLDAGARKCLTLMGSWLFILPDQLCVNINTLSVCNMQETLLITFAKIEVALCDEEGTYYQDSASVTAPSNPVHDQIWFYDGDIPSLNRYDSNSGQWITIEKTYLKISGLSGHNFCAGDAVYIDGLDHNQFGAKVNGTFYVEAAGSEYIIIAGLCRNFTQVINSSAPVTIERRVPKMDFMVEAGNRLWGCAKDSNEIYACKLGDYKNWYCFQGVSTDSWVGSIGSPGEFTGVAVQNGYPIFYKENCKHKVWPSSTGAHQLTTTVCAGVEQGSENSVAIMDGVVFYKSPMGICADDGSGGVKVDDVLADTRYHDAVGAVHGHKYYVRMLDEKGEGHLLVYDCRRKLWHREDDADIDCMISDGSSLYAGIGDGLWDLTGWLGQPEDTVEWMVQTGDLGLDIPDQKYISRITLRLSLEPDGYLELLAQYDADAQPVKLGTVYGKDLRSFSIPVRPRRCDHLKLILRGRGMCKVYAITKTLEKGSELP